MRVRQSTGPKSLELAFTPRTAPSFSKNKPPLLPLTLTPVYLVLTPRSNPALPPCRPTPYRLQLFLKVERQHKALLLPATTVSFKLEEPGARCMTWLLTPPSLIITLPIPLLPPLLDPLPPLFPPPLPPPVLAAPPRLPLSLPRNLQLLPSRWNPLHVLRPTNISTILPSDFYEVRVCTLQCLATNKTVPLLSI